jgi:hypothetical protein
MRPTVLDKLVSQAPKLCPTQPQELRSGAHCAALGSGDLLRRRVRVDVARGNAKSGHRTHTLAFYSPPELGANNVAEREIRPDERAAGRFSAAPYRVAVEAAGEEARYGFVVLIADTTSSIGFQANRVARVTWEYFQAIKWRVHDLAEAGIGLVQGITHRSWRDKRAPVGQVRSTPLPASPRHRPSPPTRRSDRPRAGGQ